MERKIEFEAGSKDNNTRKGKNYLFLIGIDSYSSVQMLKNAVRDTKAVGKVLLERYAFNKDELFELYDSEATRKNIISTFDTLADKITAEDNLLIYYAGHGYYREKLKIGYWVPVDAEIRGYAEYINHSTIRDYIRAIPAHHTLLIVDSCFSGDLLRGIGRDLSETNVYAAKVDRFPSRWCLAAGMIEKVADGFIGDHSPFARSLITFLEKNQEARFPVQEMINHVSKATSYNADQTPIGGIILKTGDQNGQFVFDLKRDEVGDWEEAKKNSSVSAFNNFIQSWPEGLYTEEAYYRLACEENSLTAYRRYIDIYEGKNGRYIDEVLDKMEVLEKDLAFQRAVQSGEASLRRFIRDEKRINPGSKYIDKAQLALSRYVDTHVEGQGLFLDKKIEENKPAQVNTANSENLPPEFVPDKSFSNKIELDTPISIPIKPPKWYWLVSGLCLVFAIVGLVASISQDTVIKPGEIPEQPELQKALIQEIPDWLRGINFIAIIAWVFGSVCLFLKKKWAYPALIINLVGSLTTSTYTSFVYAGTELNVFFIILTFLFGISFSSAFAFFAWKAKKKQWIR